jgi:heme/copper-type cytochrome/quinol oxidase subunit 4
MTSEVLLQTHAEVAIAMVGFASVIAALSRPLSAFARQRFFSLLGLSFIQILGCLLPIWFLHLSESPATSWRVVSLVVLGLNLARIWWLVLSPIRSLGQEARTILNPVVTRLTYGAGYLGFAVLLVNAIGVGFDPNFNLYYAGLLSTLLPGFALFADVATRES